MAGQASQATEYYAVLVRNCEGSSSLRPELAPAKQAGAAQKVGSTSRFSAGETAACPNPA
jgi:hypothetical protein